MNFKTARLLAFAAIALGASALPGRADAILNFNTTGSSCTSATNLTCGVVGLNGSPGTVTSLSVLNFTGFSETINGNTYNWTITGGSLTWNNSTTAPSYTFGGTITCASSAFCGSTSVTNANLFTFGGSSSNAPTDGSSLSSYNYTITNATSLTASTAFLTALQLTIPTGIASESVTGTTYNKSNDGTANNYAIGGSGTMALTLSGSNLVAASAPEPVSFLLFGTGLLAVAIYSRRAAARFSAAQKSASLN